MDDKRKSSSRFGYNKKLRDQDDYERAYGQAQECMPDATPYDSPLRAYEYGWNDGIRDAKDGIHNAKASFNEYKTL